MAAKNLNPDELKELLPISFPMTHHVAGFPGVAQYPLEEWEMGCPYLGQEMVQAGDQDRLARHEEPTDGVRRRRDDR